MRDVANESARTAIRQSSDTFHVRKAWRYCLSSVVCLGVSLTIVLLNLKGIWLSAAGTATALSMIAYGRYWRATSALAKQAKGE
jgi:hypothetical protein